MRKYKIVLCDYDGTLAGSNNQISKQNLDAINSFVLGGGIFVVCTGRATDAISKPLLAQNFKGLIASFNGAVLSSPSTNEVLYSHKIPVNDCLKFFNYTQKHDLYAHFYPQNQFLYPYRNKYTNHYEKVTGVNGIYCEDIVKYIQTNNEGSCKLLVFDDKEKLDMHFEGLKSLMDNCEVVRSTDNMIDLNLKGIDKGDACYKVASLYNMTIDDVLAMGDAGNDYAMIKEAGFSVAVSNASNEIKEIADFIAPSNDENAVKYVLEKFC